MEPQSHRDYGHGDSELKQRKFSTIFSTKQNRTEHYIRIARDI